MTEQNAVQLVEPITMTALVAAEIFTGKDGVEKILADIEAKVEAFVPDVTTAKGRKEIASMAYKCSQSKTLLDGLGKDLVADWKKQSALVDAARKTARDRLDALRDKTRAPLDAWEAEEMARIEAETQARLFNEAWDAAIVENQLFDQQREIEHLKAEAARIEAERLAKEEAERSAKEAQEAAARAEQERIENEARIRKEAEEEAARKAEAAIREAQDAAENQRKAAIKAKLARLTEVYVTPSMTAADIEALATTYNALKITTEEYQEFTDEALQLFARTGGYLSKYHAEAVERENSAAEKAERERLAAIERADREKSEAVAAEALRIENERKAAEESARIKAAAEKAEAERKAANTRHQAAVNNKAVAALVAIGISEETAKSVITAIARGNVPAVSINY